MSRSSLEKFRRRLALVAYFRGLFGFEAPLESEGVRQYYEELEKQKEGYGTEGRSYVYKFLRWKSSEGLSEEELLRYDQNIRNHLKKMNRHREDRIVFKPFQMLAAFMTEAYLDRVGNNPENFLDSLNGFVDKWNEKKAGRIKFPSFKESDLRKLAFWMATGGGKTLVMHLNYYQYLHYAEETKLKKPDNILLVTTNEGLSKQHIRELRKSGVPCSHFNAETVELEGAGKNPVKVIEISKLKLEKEDEGLSVEVNTLEGKNLVFVDEGHTGASSDTQSWRKRREAIAKRGFTFEYSATFGQAVAGSGTDIEEEYGKSILVDYSYPQFYADGYGKDYQIVNLETDIQSELREQYLLANLLSFYEQAFVFDSDREAFQDKYNVRKPLLVFIGHTVNADKNKSDLSANDEKSLSDVEDLLLFLNRVLKNKDNWVPETINKLLKGESIVSDRDVFADSFSILKGKHMGAEEIYQDVLEKVFNVENPANLEAVDIREAEGEIGLRASVSDEYFGVINIGNDQVFLDKLERHEISQNKDSITESLFRKIGGRNSEICTLLGSRKFIEGWDSWRVSTMGLMNFGQGEGPQVIQLFGRGVRLLGKGRKLKRSSELEGDHPKYLSKLEQLNIFGVRADYMETFRDYLEEEGIDTTPKKEIEIETRTKEDFEDEGLLSVRRKDMDISFSDVANLELQVSDGIEPKINLGKIGAIFSRGEEEVVEVSPEPSQIPEGILPLLNWKKIYNDIWKFREKHGFTNLVTEKQVLKEIIEQKLYTLYCPDEFLEVKNPEDLNRLTEIVAMILRSYVENYYEREKRKWEEKQLMYEPIKSEAESDNIPSSYKAKVRANATEYLKKLREKLDSDELYENEEGVPNRIHIDEHLYLPLLLQETQRYEGDVSYSPLGLNVGEENFVREIKSFLNSTTAGRMLEEYEIFLLRNQSRGNGIGFLAGEKHNDKFYPDFIMWLKKEKKQHIVFVEPHGLRQEGEPLKNHRVKFHQRVKSYEEKLSKQINKNVSLHSYVIARNPLAEVKKFSEGKNREEFHNAGLYFRDDGIKAIVKDVVY